MAGEKTIDFDADAAFKRMTFDGRKMDNPVHLFIGQFANMWETPSQMAQAVKNMGYDGISVSTWGKTGIDVTKAVDEKTGVDYLTAYIAALAGAGLGVSTFGDHLAGQAIAAAIVDKHLVGIQPPDVTRGYNVAEIVNSPALHEELRFNAALHVMNTARAMERFRQVAKDIVGPEKQQQLYNPTVVSGFTGSPIWHLLAGFPPIDEETVEIGYQEVAYRMARILDVFGNTGNRYALETHPGEIAYDLTTALRTDDTIKRPEFGFNGDSSHSVGRHWNYLKYLREISARGKLHATHLKGAAEGMGDGSGGVYRSHLQWGHSMAYWDFKSLGRGTQDEGEIIYTIDDVGFKGALENEWEDAQLDPIAGAVASAKIIRGFVDGNEALIREGLRMYQDPKNYTPGAFDATFQIKR